MKTRKIGLCGPFHQRSITWDITFVVIFAVILVFGLSLSINLSIVAHENERLFAKKSSEYLSFLKKSLEIPLWNYNAVEIQKLAEMMMANDIVCSLKILDNNGVSSFEYKKEQESEIIVFAENIQHQGRNIGHIELGLSKRLNRKQHKRILSIGLLTILAVITCVCGVIALSARRFVRKPLHELARRIDAMADGNYDSDHNTFPHWELQGIMDRFNEMIAKIRNREISLEETNRSLRIEIQEREKTESLLRQSEQRYRTLNDNMPLGVFRSDPDGRIVSFNSALLQMLNCPKSNAPVEINLYDLCEKSQDRRRLLNEIAGKQSVGRFECRLKCIDGSTIWASITARVIRHADGYIKYVDGVVEDITSRKRVEQDKDQLQNQLLQLQKMEAIGTLAGGIAHDFNNILGSIIGYSELAIGEVQADKQRLQTYLTRILEASNRAGELVGQILNFSRQGDTNRSVLSLSQLVKECIKLLDSVLPKTITIHTDINSTDDTILADATQIHQVIMNLGTNAYQAMRAQGGSLTFTLDNVQLTHSVTCMGNTILPGYYAKLRIADTGPGIPVHIQDRIFDPYFTTKEVNQGTGLGLSVTLGIVKSHGGLIQLEKSSEAGTIFSIFLPITDQQCAIAKDTVKQIVLGQNEHIIIVDDEPFFLDVLHQMLEMLNYRVTAVQSGREVLKVLLENHSGFDLLITDQTMPGMTGIQLAAEVKKINEQLPIILCTGYSELVTDKNATNYGIEQFLMKPINRKALADTVASVLKPKSNDDSSRFDLSFISN